MILRDSAFWDYYLQAKRYTFRYKLLPKRGIAKVRNLCSKGLPKLPTTCFIAINKCLPCVHNNFNLN